MPTHSRYLEQFQAYYNLMRERTVNGVASEHSRFEEMSYLTAEGSSIAKVAMAQGCCFGFAVCRGYMRAIGMDAWWNDMLDYVASWDRTYESLQQQVELPNARREPWMTLSAVIQKVMSFVVGTQYLYLRSIAAGEDEAVAEALQDYVGQEYVAQGGIPGKMELQCYLEGQFTRPMLKQLFNLPAFKSICSSRQLINLVMSFDHAAYLHCDEHGVWEFEDINRARYAYRSSDITVIVNAILKELEHGLFFYGITIDPQCDDALTEAATKNWAEEAFIEEASQEDSLSRIPLFPEAYLEDFSFGMDSHEHTLDQLKQFDTEIKSYDEINQIIKSYISSLTDEQCFHLLNMPGRGDEQLLARLMFSPSAEYHQLALAGAVRWYNAEFADLCEPEPKKHAFQWLMANVLVFSHKEVIAIMAKTDSVIPYEEFLKASCESPDYAAEAWKACPELLLHLVFHKAMHPAEYTDSRFRAIRADRHLQDKWFIENGQQSAEFSFVEFLIMNDQDTLSKCLAMAANDEALRAQLPTWQSVKRFASTMGIQLNPEIIHQFQACALKENQPMVTTGHSTALHLFGAKNTSASIQGDQVESVLIRNNI